MQQEQMIKQMWQLQEIKREVKKWGACSKSVDVRDTAYER